MSKPGRNEPCPCGSGKKFKKCCGKNNVIAFDSSMYKNELDSIQQDLIDYVFGEHEEELLELTKVFIEENFESPDVNDIDIFSELVIGWATFIVPIKQNETIFQRFAKKTMSSIKYPAVRNAFLKWNQSITSAFEIMINEDQIELRDLVTGDIFPTTNDPALQYEHGNVGVGTLVPYPATNEFFLSMIQVPKEQKEAIVALIDQNLPEDVTIGEVFPQFLADVLTLGKQPSPTADITSLDWDHFTHLRVAQAFLAHATEKGYDEKLIHTTIHFWQDYCKMNFPNVRKPEAHAAALDYFSQRSFLLFTDVTQAELAKEYGTSSGTISNHYKKLEDTFDMLRDMQESTIPSPAPNESERHMRDLMNFLEAQDFESEEEINEFLEGGFNLDELPSSDEPREIAQDLLFDAEQATGAKRAKLIREALDVYPLSPDAYALLAADERNMDKKMELLEKAVEVGEKDLGKAFFKENEGHFWGLVETRPYMRARQTYANALEDLGFTEEALEEYMDLLDLNPNDNQGIRYFLLRLFIEVEDFEAAEALIERYNESTAIFNFSKALIHFEENGITKDGVKLLKDADDANPYVVEYLTGRKQIPSNSPDFIGMGDENEAIVFVQENGHLWADAMEFLKMI